MRVRIVIGLVGVAALTCFAVATALATPPSGLVGTPLARGAAGELELYDRSERLKLVAKEPTDIPLVRATLAPNGYTGWHGHAGPSLVIVSSGELTMYEAGKRTCDAQTFGAGTAFVHPEGAHNFVAGAAGAEFYIVYFVPAGASPAPIDVTPAPEPCP
jgi:quercetin dioxygenase-like cupin family protein